MWYLPQFPNVLACKRDKEQAPPFSLCTFACTAVACARCLLHRVETVSDLRQWFSKDFFLLSLSLYSNVWSAIRLAFPNSIYAKKSSTLLQFSDHGIRSFTLHRQFWLVASFQKYVNSNIDFISEYCVAYITRNISHQWKTIFKDSLQGEFAVLISINQLVFYLSVNSTTPFRRFACSSEWTEPVYFNCTVSSVTFNGCIAIDQQIQWMM